MDLDYIRRKAMAARQFECAAGPASFTLRLPTKLESSIAYAGAHSAGRADSSAGLRFERALGVQAVVGWSGVLVRHALHSHDGDEPFEFEPGAAEVLFDAQPEWEDELNAALVDELNERAARAKAAAGN